MNIEVIEVDDNAKPKMVALVMPEKLRQKIRKEAFDREISFSAMVRLILEEHYSGNE